MSFKAVMSSLTVLALAGLLAPAETNAQAPAQNPGKAAPAGSVSLDPPMAGVVLPEEIAGPSADDIFNAWPAQARELGLEGLVRFSCVITESGAIQDCRVTQDQVRGAGFSQAALSLVPKYRFKAGTRFGQPAAIAVDFIIQFQCGVRCTKLDMSEVPQRLVVVAPWVEAPTADDVAAAYPAAAEAGRTAGKVVLECQIRGDGHLRSCDSKSEEPKGLGFRAAALALAPKFRTEGEPTSALEGATIFLPIRFESSAGRDPGKALGVPDWHQTPTNLALLQAFPKAAVDQHVTRGDATLNCQLQASGRLGDCSVAAESPAGLGFGQAALGMTGAFSMSLWSADGLPTAGARIRAPLSFRLEERATTTQKITRVEAPQWDQKPSVDQLMAAYPDRALRLSRNGEVILVCRVMTTGRVSDCQVEREEPKGLFFGDGALRLSTYFRMKPVLVDGEPVMPEGALVRVPINFVSR